jgi:hypothetical protein
MKPRCPHCKDREHQRFVARLMGCHEVWTCENPTSRATLQRGRRNDRDDGFAIVLEGCGSYTVGPEPLAWSGPPESSE